MAAWQMRRQPQPHRCAGQAASTRWAALHTRCRHQQLCSVVPHAIGGDPNEQASNSRAAMGIVYSQQQADVQDKLKFPCIVPLLPFTVEEVLLPGSVKTLHLFEARYLSLLDDILAQPNSNKVFAHVVVEQQGDAFGDTAAAFPGALQVEGYVFVMASLVRVVEVKKTFVGALVRIQAEARVQVKQLQQTLPYFKGDVEPLCDEPLQQQQLVHDQVEQLCQTMRDLQNLTQRFKSNQSACLQQALYWADRDALIPAAAPAEPSGIIQPHQADASGLSAPSSSDQGKLGTDSFNSRAADSTGSTDSSGSTRPQGGDRPEESLPTAQAAAQQDAHPAVSAEALPDVPAAAAAVVSARQDAHSCVERAVRLSFAALQGIPEESAKDQLKLLRCCVQAMKTQDTSHRLSIVQGHMQNSLNTLAAKCALKSLNLG